MRVVVVGLGVQGHKRRAVAGADVVATIDPVRDEADYRTLTDVPPGSYDAALVCTPDHAKIELLNYLISERKHVLVEKPLIVARHSQLEKLAALARSTETMCYTAYNHRFEPHFIRMKDLIESGELGEIYCLRMFYGNGTARLVRESPWRDQGGGVLPDLGSHLLDTLLFWFGNLAGPFELWTAECFENRSFDHVAFGSGGGASFRPLIQLEMTLLSWRNHFYADLLAEKGSAHISSLCKWGPATFTRRTRVLPSGRPEEEQVTLGPPDPTWEAEYAHFKDLCTGGGASGHDGVNIENDIWINDVLTQITADALAKRAK